MKSKLQQYYLALKKGFIFNVLCYSMFSYILYSDFFTF